MNAFKLILAVSAIFAASLSLASDRYKGDWEISRGARGKIDLTVTGGRVSGTMTDEGWYESTGERRTGRISGELFSYNGTLTVTWSSGAKSEFRGSFNRERSQFEFDGVRYIKGEKKADTKLKIRTFLQGYNDTDPTGSWSGSFTYGATKGHADIRVRHDDSFTGTMYGDDGRAWDVTGTIDLDRKRIRVTVDSGSSKQTYNGTYTVDSQGRVRAKFPKETGVFEITMKKHS
jgi:hypothetical protein